MGRALLVKRWVVIDDLRSTRVGIDLFKLESCSILSPFSWASACCLNLSRLRMLVGFVELFLSSFMGLSLVIRAFSSVLALVVSY